MEQRSPQRAVIYCRISRDITQEGLGVQRQELECRELCEREGYLVEHILIDNDISAYRGKHRPGWEQVKKLIRSGKVEVLVAWHPDRITRRTKELEGLIDLLSKSDVMVRTVQAGLVDLSTPSGRFQARIVGAVAQHESEQKSARQKSKARELAVAGKVGGGGTRPYGFEHDRLNLRHEEASAILWAVGQVNAGKSLGWICRNMPTPTVTGVAWKPPVLKRTLTSPRVAGLREYQGEVVGTAVWPSIVDRASWELCRSILGDPERRTNHGGQRYLLTGGMAEDHFGRKCIARPNGRKVRCYVTLPDAQGPGVRITADGLEEMVVDFVQRFARWLLLHPASPELSTKGAASPAPEEGSEIERLERELRDIGELRGQGKISAEEWWAIREPLQERLSAAMASVRVSAPAPTMEDLILVSDDWSGIDIERQRNIVSLLVGRVVIGPAVRGRNTFDPSRVSIFEPEVVSVTKVIAELSE
jgi:site-specific DNA recombinase